MAIADTEGNAIKYDDAVTAAELAVKNKTECKEAAISILRMAAVGTLVGGDMCGETDELSVAELTMARLNILERAGLGEWQKGDVCEGDIFDHLARDGFLPTVAGRELALELAKSWLEVGELEDIIYIMAISAVQDDKHPWKDAATLVASMAMGDYDSQLEVVLRDAATLVAIVAMGDNAPQRLLEVALELAY